MMPMCTFAHTPNMILSLFYSGFGYPNMIAASQRSFDLQFLDRNMFIQVTISRTNDVVISFVNLLYCMEWHPTLTFSFIVCIDRSSLT